MGKWVKAITKRGRECKIPTFNYIDKSWNM